MTIDEQKLLREHYEIMADIRSIKEDIKQGKTTNSELVEKLEVLERRAAQNDMDHSVFVKHQELVEIRDALRTLKDGMVVMTPAQAKDAGNGWFSILMKNPTYLMWLILAAVVISMVGMGYSFVEISQVLNKIK